MLGADELVPQALGFCPRVVQDLLKPRRGVYGLRHHTQPGALPQRCLDAIRQQIRVDVCLRQDSGRDAMRQLEQREEYVFNVPLRVTILTQQILRRSDRLSCLFSEVRFFKNHY